MFLSEDVAQRMEERRWMKDLGASLPKTCGWGAPEGISAEKPAGSDWEPRNPGGASGQRLAQGPG